MELILKEVLIQAIRLHDDWVCSGHPHGDHTYHSDKADIKIKFDFLGPHYAIIINGQLTPTWWWERAALRKELEKALARRLTTNIAAKSEHRIQEVLTKFKTGTSQDLERAI